MKSNNFEVLIVIEEICYCPTVPWAIKPYYSSDLLLFNFERHNI